MVKKCTPCILRANSSNSQVDIWLKNVHLAYDVPSIPRSPCPLRFPLPSSLPLFWTPTRVSVRCPSGHTGAGMCACGEGRPPTHSAARTPSQAPLGWGRVPPCTGPRQAGLPRKCSFPLSRPIQYLSPPLARATVQLTFEAVLLLASLPRKGTDKEAGALRAEARSKGGAPSACACVRVM